MAYLCVMYSADADTPLDLASCVIHGDECDEWLRCLRGQYIALSISIYLPWMSVKAFSAAAVAAAAEFWPPGRTCLARSRAISISKVEVGED